MDIEKLEVIRNLAKLAMEAQLSRPINWEASGINKNDAYETMATNVVNQFENVEQENFAAIAMATITKLLVENYVLNLYLSSGKDDQ